VSSTIPDRQAPSPAPREGRWPGLHEVPSAPLRARAARAIFHRAVSGLNLRVLFPGGRVAGRGGPDSPVLRIRREAPFFARLGRSGLIGFGEAYMVGDWDADERGGGLAGVLTAFAARLTTLVPAPLQRLRRWYDQRPPAGEDNTVEGARRNIHRHYDLSNDLFGIFLDETMTYSSAWFEPGDTLADAQRRKIDGILDMAGVREGSEVLEIGTGWGALAIRAASERGARVTTVTISEEQKTLADKRVAAAGVADRVDVQLRDYREIDGQYDAVVSVEMIEAVGEEYWPTYFATLDRTLRPGGRVGLQAILMDHDRMLATRRSYSWIHKYIFPGGLIPSREAIDRALHDASTLRVTHHGEIGHHYATTLRMWRQRFLAQRERVHSLGFDHTFVRMWEFYLAYCEAGFATGALGNAQLRLARR
jgi:cyclopropane-fatty-acyl-phospholipid synthase